jgi:hypothetical protein
LEEGTLRSHMIVAEGRIRDSVYYSVLRDEWPRVQRRLEEMLARPFGERDAALLSGTTP